MTDGTGRDSGGRSADLAVYEAVRAHEVMLNEATAAFEHAVLAPLFVLNGGAAVAFVTLTGAASGDGSSLSVNIGAAITAVLLWVAGLLAAAAATWWGFKVQQGISVAGRWRRQRIELEYLDMSWGIRQLVVNKAIGHVAENEKQGAELKEWEDAARTRLDENAGEKQDWWGRKRPWFEILVSVSVAFFSAGAIAAAVAVAV